MKIISEIKWPHVTSGKIHSQSHPHLLGAWGSMTPSPRPRRWVSASWRPHSPQRWHIPGTTQPEQHTYSEEGEEELPLERAKLQILHYKTHRLRGGEPHSSSQETLLTTPDAETGASPGNQWTRAPDSLVMCPGFSNALSTVHLQLWSRDNLTYLVGKRTSVMYSRECSLGMVILPGTKKVTPQMGTHLSRFYYHKTLALTHHS